MRTQKICHICEETGIQKPILTPNRCYVCRTPCCSANDHMNWKLQGNEINITCINCKSDK